MKAGMAGHNLKLRSSKKSDTNSKNNNKISAVSLLLCIPTVPMWINEQPPIYTHGVFFHKVAIWNSVNHHPWFALQACYKTWLIQQTFTEHQFNSQHCWIRVLWILGLAMQMRGGKRRQAKEENAILPHSLAVPGQTILIFCSLPSHSFWGPSDFPGPSIHRFP